MKVISCLALISSWSLTLLHSQQTDQKRINNSFIAFTIPEKNLIPENLAFNPKDQSFYVGSTHQRKVVKVSPDGKTVDFIKEQQDGQWMVVGMKIDTLRQLLWFCSSIGDVMKGYRDGDFGTRTGVFKYDLGSGKLIKKYLLERTGELHFFNDLVINRSGDVFITDMAANTIFMIRAAKDELEILSKPANFTDPNGICISPDEQKLFVVTEEGISTIDIKTGIAKLLAHPPGLKVNGIDGLYFYKASLIAVQNSVRRIVQFYLDNDLAGIIDHRILESNHPFFGMNPTTGTISGSTFYFIANSQFGSFTDDHMIYPMNELYEVVVLKMDLSLKE